MARPIEEELVDALGDRGETLAVAESCTGGLVSSLVTDIPGASDIFVEGVVAYRPEVKVRALGVDRQLIADEGVVSAPVAEAMATGVRDRAGADRSLATTGYAGPEGGTDRAPVGTVVVAVASADGVSSRRHRLEGDRRRVKEAMARQALADLLDALG